MTLNWDHASGECLHPPSSYRATRISCTVGQTSLDTAHFDRAGSVLRPQTDFKTSTHTIPRLSLFLPSLAGLDWLELVAFVGFSSLKPMSWSG